MEFPKVLTDGGDHVIIYTTQGKGYRPIHGAYWSGDSHGWVVTQWDPKGYRNSETCTSKLDISKVIQSGTLNALFPPEEKKEG